MRTLLILFIASIVSLNVSAQGFFKPGAHWHSYTNGETLILYHEVKYVGDTTINNQLIHKLSRDIWEKYPTSPTTSATTLRHDMMYFSYNADTLFYHAFNNKEIYTIFRDGAEWEIENECMIRSDYYSTETVGNQTHQIFTISYSDSTISDQPIRKVSDRFVFLETGFYGPIISCIPFANELVHYLLYCYSDSTGFSINNVSDCNFFKTLDFENLELASFTLTPNPAQNIVQINSELTIDNLNVTSMNGQIFDLNFDKSQKSLDISILPNGVYFVTIESQNQKVTKKLVVI